MKDNEHSQNVSVICIGRDGYAAVQSGLPSAGRATANAYYRRWWEGVTFFHQDGNRYEVASADAEQRSSLLSRVLAATVYNPRMTVRYEYRNLGPYRLEDLCQAVAAAIDEDDDILTQFHTADDLKQRLARAQSFEDVASVLSSAESD